MSPKKEHEVIKALRIAEELLRKNRYTAEADMCKTAFKKQAAILLDLERIKSFAAMTNLQKHDGFDAIRDIADKALR